MEAALPIAAPAPASYVAEYADGAARPTHAPTPPPGHVGWAGSQSSASSPPPPAEAVRGVGGRVEPGAGGVQPWSACEEQARVTLADLDF